MARKRDHACAVGCDLDREQRGRRRCGDLGVDSNLPDVRIAHGGPEVDSFTAEVLERSGISGDGAFWVPLEKPLGEMCQPRT